MTKRDNLAIVLQDNIVAIGLTDDTKKLFHVRLLTTVLKMVQSGRSKYAIVTELNRQSNKCGRDLVPVVIEVYELVRQEEF